MKIEKHSQRQLLQHQSSLDPSFRGSKILPEGKTVAISVVA